MTDNIAIAFVTALIAVVLLCVTAATAASVVVAAMFLLSLLMASLPLFSIHAAFGSMVCHGNGLAI